MNIHVASPNTSRSLPQGFSVYQPSLGSQLQFFPAMGTRELDEMLHAFLPGSASIADKRAAVSVDFLEHLHLTGQTFKFYHVETLASAPSTSATSSPASVSGASSSSGFPATPNWDFSNIAYAPSSSSSQRSTSASHARRSTKPATVTRHQTTDFSHLPGMKIMTRDGIDVTNAASRGSKTKEQRDHAHLMRIIKACDSCRAKKIRCDPSHKKRAATATSVSGSATPQSQSSSNARNKRQKTLVRVTPTPSVVPPPSPVTTSEDFSWDNFDASTAWADLDNFDPFAFANDDWSEFMHFPGYVPGTDGYGLEAPGGSLYSQGFSPTSSFTNTTSTPSAASTKPQSPADVSASHTATSPNTTQDHLSMPVVGNDLSTWTSDLLGSGVDRSHAFATDQSHVMNVNGIDRGAPATMSDSATDVGYNATLLPSADASYFDHRLDDPGSGSNTMSTTAPVENTVVLNSSIQAGSWSINDVSRRRVLTSQQQSQSLLVTSPADLHVPSPAVDLDRTTQISQTSTSSDVRLRKLDIAATQNSVEGPLAGIGDRGAGILGLLPLSDPVVSGLAQLMLGGTSDILATSPPLSSSTLLATVYAAMATVAASFMLSMAPMLAVAHRGDRLAQNLLSQVQQHAQHKSARASHRNDRCRSLHPSAFAAVPQAVGIAC